MIALQASCKAIGCERQIKISRSWYRCDWCTLSLYQCGTCSSFRQNGAYIPSGHEGLYIPAGRGDVEEDHRELPWRLKYAPNNA